MSYVSPGRWREDIVTISILCDNPVMNSTTSPKVETRRSPDVPIDVAVWLFGLTAMVFAMVVIGGLTRLTQSGLSIVEWRPLTGWLPPQNQADWMALFEQYKQFPEFREKNTDMTLAGFKSIFWLEFIHRVWGRLLGIAFIVPFVWYSMRGWISRRLLWRLMFVFLLSKFVKVGDTTQEGLLLPGLASGLVDRPDVSQYRLVAHLGLALLIFAYLLWISLDCLGRHGVKPDHQKITGGALLIIGWIAVTILAGGFVAGLDAGLTYNTFPLMDGKLIPDGLFSQTPFFLNFFENITTVQFDHRILAESLLIIVLAYWWYARDKLFGAAKLALNGLTVMVITQLGLEIGTLLLEVPVPLAAAHQAGALLVLGFAVWLLREIAFMTPVKSR